MYHSAFIGFSSLLQETLVPTARNHNRDVKFKPKQRKKMSYLHILLLFTNKSHNFSKKKTTTFDLRDIPRTSGTCRMSGASVPGRPQHKQLHRPTIAGVGDDSDERTPAAQHINCWSLHFSWRRSSEETSCTLATEYGHTILGF